MCFKPDPEFLFFSFPLLRMTALLEILIYNGVFAKITTGRSNQAGLTMLLLYSVVEFVFRTT